MNISNSIKLFEHANKYIPGGVNSPVRAFKSVGGNPIFMKYGKGCIIIDVDGNSYIDFIGSWGPHIFGHNPDFIRQAIADSLDQGTSFGAPTEAEVTMAELICELVPSIDKVRMVNSGTEATMSAIRLARGFTQKEKIIKFEGCYHGHADSFLIKAGSGALTFGVPTSPGVTNGTAMDTLIAKFNDFSSVVELVDSYPDQIAAIILEPICGNMGVVAADKEFLQQIRLLCDSNGILLIFDEVMTGFRVAQGGAAQLYGISPDLTTFGKIIGGGLPVGAYGGKSQIMDFISPVGPVYQAGTLSGNPLAMSAGIATLSYIRDNPDIYDILEFKSMALEQGFRDAFNKLGLNLSLNRVGSMMSLFFTDIPVTDLSTAMLSNTNYYAQYFHNMLNQGIYLAPAQFEALFVSTEHSDRDIDRTISAAKSALESIYN